MRIGELGTRAPQRLERPEVEQGPDAVPRCVIRALLTQVEHVGLEELRHLFAAELCERLPKTTAVKVAHMHSTHASQFESNKRPWRVQHR